MKAPTFTQRMMQSIGDLFYVWREELRVIFRDQGVLIFFVIVPLIYPLIYAFIYTNEVIRQVPAVVVDQSGSSLSRDYLRKLDATPEVAIVAHCPDMEAAKELLKRRKAYGIIYIPPSFSEDIVQGKQTQVSLYCDMSGLLYYKALLNSNTAVSLEMNAAIKIHRVDNTTKRQDEITAYPIAYEDVALFNPTNGFAAFLIPPVLILIIQQTLLLGIGLSVGTDREKGEFKKWLPIYRHRNGTLSLVLGKGLNYLTLYLLVAVYILCVVPHLFSLNQIAQPATLALFLLPYLTASVFFAMTLSIFVRNRETCMLLFVFTSVPLLFLSGISWPGSAMPPFWRYFSYLFPSTLGINGYVRINSMGATLNEVSFEYKALWLQTIVYLFTAYCVFRRLLKRGNFSKK